MPPGEGRLGAEPLVLRHHAQGNPHPGQYVNRGRENAPAGHPVPLPPDMIEQGIKNRHGDRGDPFPQPQGVQGKNAGVLPAAVCYPLIHPADAVLRALAGSAVCRAAEDLMPDAFHCGSGQFSLGFEIVVNRPERHAAGRSGRLVWRENRPLLHNQKTEPAVLPFKST